MLSNPAFLEKCDPYHHEQAINDGQRRVKPVLDFSPVDSTYNHHSGAENAAHDHRRYEPSSIVNHPSEMKGNLLSIVIFDHIKRLHIVSKIGYEHSTRQSKPVLSPAFKYLRARRYVQREMAQYNLVFGQVIKVKLLLQDF